MSVLMKSNLIQTGKFGANTTYVVKNFTIIASDSVFGLRFYVPVNSYGHVEIVSSSNHTYFLDKLDKAVNQLYFYTYFRL